MSVSRHFVQALPLAILLAGCAISPTITDPRHNPADASAVESPLSKSSNLLMESPPQVSFAESHAPTADTGMKDMPGMGSAATPASSVSGKAIYTCPMHPEVQQDNPGKCPKCGMTLVREKTEDRP